MWAALKWSNRVKVRHALRPRGQSRSSSHKNHKVKKNTQSQGGLSFCILLCSRRDGFNMAGKDEGRYPCVVVAITFFYSACVTEKKYFWHFLIGGNMKLSTIWLCADERKSKSVTQCEAVISGEKRGWWHRSLTLFINGELRGREKDGAIRRLFQIKMDPSHHLLWSLLLELSYNWLTIGPFNCVWIFLVSSVMVSLGGLILSLWCPVKLFMINS